MRSILYGSLTCLVRTRHTGGWCRVCRNKQYNTLRVRTGKKQDQAVSEGYPTHRTGTCYQSIKKRERERERALFHLWRKDFEGVWYLRCTLKNG